jgi:hypothetical protein
VLVVAMGGALDAGVGDALGVGEGEPLASSAGSVVDGSAAQPASATAATTRIESTPGDRRGCVGAAHVAMRVQATLRDIRALRRRQEMRGTA